MSDKAQREKTFDKLVRKQKIGFFFVSSIVKRRRSLWDRLKVWTFSRMMSSSKRPEDDFMRDELVDAEPEFSIEELRQFQEGGRES